jgi:hypothetical protein
VLAGAASGIVAAGSGYLKNAGSEFSMQNFAETVFEGAVVGAVAGSLGISYSAAEDYLKKTLTRRVFPWLMRKLNKPA